MIRMVIMYNNGKASTWNILKSEFDRFTEIWTSFDYLRPPAVVLDVTTWRDPKSIRLFLNLHEIVEITTLDVTEENLDG